MARITVEDCLEQLPNRFSLVLVSANRTKQLLRGAHPMIDESENKEVVTALREIAAGKIDVDDSDVLDYDLWMPQHRRKAPEEDEAFDDELPPEA